VSGLVTGGAEGLVLLEHSAATLARTGTPVEHARVLIDLGAAIRRAGRRAEARPPLREGLALARRHGAVPLVTLAETELAASGVRVAGRDGGLTPSELRVAQLAAAGRTNREIAGSLRISVKAVEWHLHLTYRKLGINGRRELATALPEPGSD
jgi:DNA-binding CsgD family transcriptional regulator